MSFKDYKKNRKVTNDKIDKKIEELNSNPFADDRFWELSVDKSGNGSAIIRLLPAKDGEDIPFVQIFEHKFKGPGGWYMEMCLTTPRITGKTDGACPVCDDNRELWNSGLPDNKTIVSGDQTNNTPGRKRKLSYISNILVVKDPTKPENNGKIFLFRYGAQIYELVQAARTPEIEDEVAINPFDMIEGANFNLIAKLDKGFRSYKSSKFSKPSPVDKEEKKMEDIYNNLYSIHEFIRDNKFKSEDDLNSRFAKVLGNSKRVAELSQNDDNVKSEPKIRTRRAAAKEEITDDENTQVLDEADDGDSKLAMFKALAED